MADDKDLEPGADQKPASQKSDSVMEGLYYGEVERTFKTSAYHPDSFLRPYNPDKLVQQDFTYGIYEEMLRDDQVDVALKIKKDLVVGSGWYLDTNSDDTGIMVKELENLLSDETVRPLSEILEDIIQAYEFGFSISEKIFKKTHEGKLALKDIKPRHPSTWLLHTDDYGNVTRYEQRGASASIDVDPNSIIHYINNGRHQNPYGQSDLYAAHQAWLTKRHVSRYYAIYLENAAGPKPVAKYDRRAPQSVIDSVFNAIKTFQVKTAMTIPKEFEVEFLEAKTNGEAYIKGLNLFNMFIGRALFIPDLLGFQGSETGGGSFSLGSEQIGLFYKHIYRRRQILERIMDQHVIRPLVIYNYGIQEDYPKFKFMPLSDVDAMKQAEAWIKGVQGVGWKPSLDEVNHFRTLVKFPLSDELEMKGDAMAEALGGNAENDPENEDGEAEGAEAENEDTAKEDGKEAPETEKDAENDTAKKELAMALSTLPGDYKKRIDFKMADNMMKNSQMKILEELEPIVTDAFEDLYSQLEKSNILETQNIENIDKITIRGKFLKQMQGVFKKHFRGLYKDSQIMAKAEVKRADNAAPNENVATDEFLEFLNKETFQYVGDWKYNIDKKTRNAINAAIKDGRPISSVVGVLDDEGKALSDVSLERYSRTKSTEVFNRGRMEYFNSTGIIEAYQYAAILDDVTSEICGSLHGLTFPAGSAPVPPLHFNALTADALILTSKGIYRIDQVNIGDRVLTHAGNWCRVYDVMSKFEDKEYYEINLENGETLNATGEHPVLINRNGSLGWIRVDELTESDDVVCLEDIVDKTSVA